MLMPREPCAWSTRERPRRGALFLGGDASFGGGAAGGGGSRNDSGADCAGCAGSRSRRSTPEETNAPGPRRDGSGATTDAADSSSEESAIEFAWSGGEEGGTRRESGSALARVPQLAQPADRARSAARAARRRGAGEQA